MFEIANLDEELAKLADAWKEGCDELGVDLERDAGLAAEDGVDAVKANHPYQDRTHDLTDSAHANPLASGAAMIWPQNYAGFVDKGTSRSKPYPFTPEAERVATRSLEVRATFSTEKLADKMNR